MQRLILILIVCLTTFVTISPVLAEIEGEFGVMAGFAQLFKRNDGDKNKINLDDEKHAIGIDTIYAMATDDTFALGVDITLINPPGHINLRSAGARIMLLYPHHTVTQGYFVAKGGLALLSDSSNSELEPTIGVGTGIQWRVRDPLLFRAEARYQFFIGQSEPKNSNWSLIVGIGIRPKS